MNTATEQSTVESIAEAVASRIAELRDRALEEAAEREASLRERIDEFDRLAEELEAKRRRLAELEPDYERLPGEAYRAKLDGDPELEAELAARYEQVAAEVPTLRRRCAELEQHLPTFYDRNRAERDGVDDAVAHRQETEVAPGRPAAEARAELAQLRVDLLEQINEAILDLARDHQGRETIRHQQDKLTESARRLRS